MSFGICSSQDAEEEHPSAVSVRSTSKVAVAGFVSLNCRPVPSRSAFWLNNSRPVARAACLIGLLETELSPLLARTGEQALIKNAPTSESLTASGEIRE